MSYSTVTKEELDSLINFIHQYETAPTMERQKIIHHLAEIIKDNQTVESPYQLHLNL